MSNPANGYDLFLSYTRADTAAAEKLRALLADAGLHAFLDRYALPAGQPWQPQLEAAIASCRTLLVLLGPSGLGTWQHREIQLGLDRQAAIKEAVTPFGVIPVLLPDLQDDNLPLGTFLALNTWIDLRQGLDDPEALQRLIAGAQGRAIETDHLLASLCPYRGLLPFREQDAGLFFGRQRFVDELVAKVGQRTAANTVAVVGRSGSGKSSIVYAGLFPALRREKGMGQQAVWDIVSLRPQAEPLHQLARAFAPPAQDADPIAIRAALNAHAERFRKSEVTVAELVRDRLQADRGSTRLLLYVDQWEELYTQAQPREVVNEEDKRRVEDARRFVDLLLEAAAIAPCTLVLSVRSDFYPDIQGHDRLRAAVQDGQVSLGPMSEPELRAAIEGPAEKLDVRVQPDLTKRLLRDIGLDVTAARDDQNETAKRVDQYDIGKLPLLEYALEQAWAKRKDAEIGLGQYAGLEQALEERANQLYEHLPTAQQAAAKRLFVSLVMPGEGREDTRARITLQADATVEAVVEAFAGGAARLIVTGDAAGSRSVEVSHEALIRHWKRLRRWVDENRENLRTRATLVADQAEWLKQNKNRSLLIEPGLRLEAARLLRDQPGDVVVDDLKDYIDTSLARDARQRRWRTLGLAAALLVAMLMAGLAWFAWEKWDAAALAEQLATTRAEEALVAEGEAEKAKTEAQHQEAETIHQTRAGTLAAAGYARSFVANGEARLGALVALGVLPTNRAADDPRYVPEAEAALAHALSLPIETMRLRGHKDDVTSVAFSPDGRRIVSGSEDKTLRLWDGAIGQQIGEPLRGHEYNVSSVAFSRDGRRIVSGSEDKTLRLWDAATGQPLGEPLRGHEDSVTSVAFSPDGRRIVSGSEDQTLRLWDAATGQPLGEPLRGHEDSVWSVAFSPDGRRIVSGSRDQALRLWDAATGQQIGEPLRGHENGVWSVAFSPDGRRIVSGSRDQALRLWDAATGQQIGEPLRGHEDSVLSVAFSRDGRRIVSGSWDQTLRLWDAATGQQIGEPLRGHEDSVWSVAFSPDGRRIVSGSEDNTLRLWDAATGQPLGEPLRGHKDHVLSVAFSRDGRRIVSGSGSWDQTLRLWDGATGQPLGEPLRGHEYGVSSVAFSRDGRRIVSGSADQTLRLWDVATGQQIGEPLRGHEYNVSSVAFSRDGRRIVSGSWDQTLRLWDVATGQQTGEPLRGHGNSVLSVAFSPDGRRIVSGSEDNTLRLWDAATGQPLGEPLRGHEDGVWSVAFSPDGRRIVSGSRDQTLRLWDVATGQQIGEPLRGHEYGVSSVAFSRDGRRIVSGSADQTLRLWDVATGQQIGEPLRGHENGVTSVAFSPDGRRIVSGSEDNTLRLWDVGYLAVSLPELATKAELLCPLSRREQVTLHLRDPQLDERAPELTADQQRACGGDNEP